MIGRRGPMSLPSEPWTRFVERSCPFASDSAVDAAATSAARFLRSALKANLGAINSGKSQRRESISLMARQAWLGWTQVWGNSQHVTEYMEPKGAMTSKV